MTSTIHEIIMETFRSTAEQTGATLVDDLNDETILLESGLDSLGFAILVSRLEEELDYDPFSLSDDPYYPSTFGEFVKFYEQNKPS